MAQDGRTAPSAAQGCPGQTPGPRALPPVSGQVPHGPGQLPGLLSRTLSEGAGNAVQAPLRIRRNRPDGTGDVVVRGPRAPARDGAHRRSRTLGRRPGEGQGGAVFLRAFHADGTHSRGNEATVPKGHGHVSPDAQRVAGPDHTQGPRPPHRRADLQVQRQDTAAQAVGEFGGLLPCRSELPGQVQRTGALLRAAGDDQHGRQPHPQDQRRHAAAPVLPAAGRWRRLCGEHRPAAPGPAEQRPGGGHDSPDAGP